MKAVQRGSLENLTMHMHMHMCKMVNQTASYQTNPKKKKPFWNKT